MMNVTLMIRETARATSRRERLSGEIAEPFHQFYMQRLLVASAHAGCSVHVAIGTFPIRDFKPASAYVLGTTKRPAPSLSARNRDSSNEEW
jgi:hypothetical protein